MIRKILIGCLIFSSLVNADIFVRGGKHIGFSVGAGTNYGNTYTIVGVYGNYFVIDNLSLGVGYRGWFGDTPSQNEILADATYFFPISAKFHPYAGVLARQVFIEKYDDFQTYGAKAGVAITMSSNSYLALGYVVESYTHCIEDQCSVSYPEFVLGVSF